MRSKPMQGSETHPPLSIVKMQVFQCDGKAKDAVADEIAEALTRRFEKVAVSGDSLEVSFGKIRHRLTVDESSGFFVLRSNTDYGRDYELDAVIKNDLRLFDITDLGPSLPALNPLSTFTVFMPVAEDEHVAVSLAEEYSRHLSRPKPGIGIVRESVLSILEPENEEKESFDRYYFLSPIHVVGEEAEKRVESVLSEIRHLAIHTAELSKLYNSCQSFFSALETGEMEVKEKTEDFLFKLIGPEPAGLESLESWLRYIMEREATITTMIGTMQGNRLEAKLIVSKLDSLFRRLNEVRFEGYPTNTELELDGYRGSIEPFERYIVRSEAMKTRLETIMDEVRTYLSLQQQKTSIEEQKASKEQLIRLVNLQEILHKLEILIVAFYLTEMARIVFEPVFHDAAGLLTAAFIPFALIISVGVGRLLHREH